MKRTRRSLRRIAQRDTNTSSSSSSSRTATATATATDIGTDMDITTATASATSVTTGTSTTLPHKYKMTSKSSEKHTCSTSSSSTRLCTRQTSNSMRVDNEDCNASASSASCSSGSEYEEEVHSNVLRRRRSQTKNFVGGDESESLSENSSPKRRGKALVENTSTPEIPIRTLTPGSCVEPVAVATSKRMTRGRYGALPAASLPTPQHLSYPPTYSKTSTAKSCSITGAGGRSNVIQPPPSTGKETQKSLSEITQAFLKYIRNSSDPESIDLSEFCTEYDIVKRRIYDITCVMEGVGLLEKRNKNVIAWTGGSLGEGSETEELSDSEIAQMKNELNHEVIEMEGEEKVLDTLIEKMSEDQDYGDKLHLSFNTIRKLYNENEMLLGIRAPRGTVLTVPDPDENMPRGIRRFEVDLTTPGVNTGVITMDMIQPEYMQDYLKNQLTTTVPAVVTSTSVGKQPLASVPTVAKHDSRPSPQVPPIPPPQMPIPAHLFPPGTIPPPYLNMPMPPYPYPHPYMHLPPFVPPPHGILPSNHPAVATNTTSTTMPPTLSGSVKDAMKAASEVIAAATATSKKRRRLLPKVAPSSKSLNETVMSQPNIKSSSMMMEPEQDSKQLDLSNCDDSKLAVGSLPAISGTPPRTRNLMGTPPRKRAIFDLDSPIKSTPMRTSTLFTTDFQSPGLSLLETPNAGISSFGSFQESPMTFQSPMISFARLGDDGDKSGNDDIFFERTLFSKSFESKED